MSLPDQIDLHFCSIWSTCYGNYFTSVHEKSELCADSVKKKILLRYLRPLCRHQLLNKIRGVHILGCWWSPGAETGQTINIFVELAIIYTSHQIAMAWNLGQYLLRSISSDRFPINYFVLVAPLSPWLFRNGIIIDLSYIRVNSIIWLDEVYNSDGNCVSIRSSYAHPRVNNFGARSPFLTRRNPLGQALRRNNWQKSHDESASQFIPRGVPSNSSSLLHLSHFELHGGRAIFAPLTNPFGFIAQRVVSMERICFFPVILSPIFN